MQRHRVGPARSCVWICTPPLWPAGNAVCLCCLPCGTPLNPVAAACTADCCLQAACCWWLCAAPSSHQCPGKPSSRIAWWQSQTRLCQQSRSKLCGSASAGAAWSTFTSRKQQTLTASPSSSLVGSGHTCKSASHDVHLCLSRSWHVTQAMVCKGLGLPLGAGCAHQPLAVGLSHS